jgi:hypothetical protein
MKLEFSRQIFEKSSNIKFHENPSSESRVVQCLWTDGRTDITKLVVAFRNFVKAPKKENVFLRFRDNSARVNAPLCKFVRTLSVLFPHRVYLH